MVIFVAELSPLITTVLYGGALTAEMSPIITWSGAPNAHGRYMTEKSGKATLPAMAKADFTLNAQIFPPEDPSITIGSKHYKRCDNVARFFIFPTPKLNPNHHLKLNILVGANKQLFRLLELRPSRIKYTLENNPRKSFSGFMPPAL